TLTTSAPRSASSRPASAPRRSVRSTTRRWASGAGMPPLYSGRDRANKSTGPRRSTAVQSFGEFMPRAPTKAECLGPPAPAAAAGGLMSPDRLIVPVRGAERVLGTIELTHRYDGRPFDEADRERAGAVAAELASTEDLERVAHDPDALHGVFARLAAAVPSED